MVKREPKKTITFRLSKKNKQVHNVLRELAEKENVSTNSYIERIIIDHLIKIGATWETDDE